LRRVVVTGLGTINPLGNTVETSWNSLINSKSGISKITKFEVDDYPCKIAGTIDDSKIKADIWEENPSSGNVTYIELEGEDKNKINVLLKEFALSLPRKPWEYTLFQKLRNGWFSQGIFRAKLKWEDYVR